MGLSNYLSIHFKFLICALPQENIQQNKARKTPVEGHVLIEKMCEI